MKKCPKCKITKKIDNFHPDKKRGVSGWCKNCHNLGIRLYKRKLRKEAIKKYGGRCICCGETNYEFLTFEHKNGDGAEHRRKLGRHFSSFSKFLKDNNYPDFIEILCYNCNCSKGFWGYCPHNYLD